ncbi:hypothetical protein GCM10009107_15360 [Ideonella azotifigens]|uniref:Uncharacterized protein n=1 Tax=Ideonella azotifigens TaxID=513160 RepID=A0ABN1JUZ2_9BURK
MRMYTLSDTVERHGMGSATTRSPLGKVARWGAGRAGSDTGKGLRADQR